MLINKINLCEKLQCGAQCPPHTYICISTIAHKYSNLQQQQPQMLCIKRPKDENSSCLRETAESDFSFILFKKKNYCKHTHTHTCMCAHL